MPRFARLHIFTLSSFAIAQPLYDVVGRNAEFLVAHRAGVWTIAALVGALSFLIPLMLLAIVEGARRIGAAAGYAAQIAIVGGLTALFAAGALRNWPAPIASGLAAIAAIVSAWAYQSRGVRTFLTLASPAVLIFPIVFVAATPVARLVRPAGTHRSLAGPAIRQPPIVIVVFDELDTLTLLDGEGRIDAERFPHFAELARTSTWFPNAVASSPYTPYALPAIASGRRTNPSLKKLPSAADYPDNLFTWLGTTYRLHVVEPITALCPAVFCDSTNATPTERGRELASDLAVIYLHLVTPREMAASLPPVAFAWKGFVNATAPEPAAAGEPESKPDAAFDRAAHHARDEHFRRWLAGITPAGEPTLHFMHSLLPHEPYQYLPSGRLYAKSELTAGLSPDWSWTPSHVLVETGRIRHEAQVRFVDALVGELVAHLRAAALFDPALLIVTSDHGAAFIAGDSHRGLTAVNYREILPVPLFVKTPFQKGGRIDERRASGYDILPTVAAALGSEVPWTSDGESVLAETFPNRTTFEYPGIAVPPLAAIDVREEARRVMRERRPLTPHTALIGRPLSELDVMTSSAGMQVLSNDLRNFDAVVPDRFLPALVEGRLERGQNARDTVHIAVAVNGVVRAVTETAAWAGSPHFFTAFLGEYEAQRGANEVNVFALDPEAPTRRLVLLSTDLASGVTLRADGSGEFLETRTGRRLALDRSITGFVDRIDDEADGYVLHGWAVDREARRQVRAIAVFSGGSSVSLAFPTDVRPDVTTALSLPPSIKVAFSLKVNREHLSRSTRVLAIGHTRAGEVQLSGQARQVLAQRQ